MQAGILNSMTGRLTTALQAPERRTESPPFARPISPTLPVFRTLSCPANASSEHFRKTLQIAFGSPSTHCYDFKVNDSIGEARREAREAKIDLAQIIEYTTTYGTRGPMTRYPLRIVEEHPLSPGRGFMGAKEVVFMRNNQLQHPRHREVEFESKVA